MFRIASFIVFRVMEKFNLNIETGVSKSVHRKSVIEMGGRAEGAWGEAFFLI